MPLNYHRIAQEIIDTLKYAIPRFWADKDVRGQIGYLQAMLARAGHDLAPNVHRAVERRTMRPAHETWQLRLEYLWSAMQQLPREPAPDPEAPDDDWDILQNLATGRLDLLLQNPEQIDRLAFVLGECDRRQYGLERFYRFALELGWLHDALKAWRIREIDPLRSLERQD